MSGWIYLSYELSSELSSYGGVPALTKNFDKKMSCGDSCNASSLHLSAHAGTHIDYPFHFSDSGKSGSSYEPRDWIFNHVKHIELDHKAMPGRIYTVKDFEKVERDSNLELLLLDTGFHKIRASDTYWNNNPGFHPEVASFLKSMYPSLKAIGMDSISMNPWTNKELGREAHRKFLNQENLLIIEDMNFNTLKGKRIETVIIAPLRIKDADGAPVTVLAKVL